MGRTGVHCFRTVKNGMWDRGRHAVNYSLAMKISIQKIIVMIRTRMRKVPMRMIGSEKITKRCDVRKIALVLAVFATFFVSYAVTACGRPDVDCPPANDCPVWGAYQELPSGESFAHAVAVNPPSFLIATLIPTVVNGFHNSDHSVKPSSRAPPSPDKRSFV